MIVSGKNAALLVIFFFILIAPATAFGKSTNFAGDDTLKPWVAEMAKRSDYGYVNFECMIEGTPMFGRVYTIN